MCTYWCQRPLVLLMNLKQLSKQPLLTTTNHCPCSPLHLILNPNSSWMSAGKWMQVMQQGAKYAMMKRVCCIYYGMKASNLAHGPRRLRVSNEQNPSFSGQGVRTEKPQPITYLNLGGLFGQIIGRSFQLWSRFWQISHHHWDWPTREFVRLHQSTSETVQITYTDRTYSLKGNWNYLSPWAASYLKSISRRAVLRALEISQEHESVLTLNFCRRYGFPRKFHRSGPKK